MRTRDTELNRFAMSLQAVANEMGMKRSAIASIEKSALKKCRDTLVDKGYAPGILISMLRSL